MHFTAIEVTFIMSKWRINFDFENVNGCLEPTTHCLIKLLFYPVVSPQNSMRRAVTEAPLPRGNIAAGKSNLGWAASVYSK